MTISCRMAACTFGLLVFVGGCTFAPPKVRLEVKWAPPAAKLAAPDRVDDISCFFVNVRAADILVNYGPESFGGRSPSCLDLGVISGPFTLSELTKGVILKVQPGSQRTIEILEAVSSARQFLSLHFAGLFWYRVAAAALFAGGHNHQNFRR